MHFFSHYGLRGHITGKLLFERISAKRVIAMKTGGPSDSRSGNNATPPSADGWMYCNRAKWKTTPPSAGRWAGSRPHGPHRDRLPTTGRLGARQPRQSSAWADGSCSAGQLAFLRGSFSQKRTSGCLPIRLFIIGLPSISRGLILSERGSCLWTGRSLFVLR